MRIPIFLLALSLPVLSEPYRIVYTGRTLGYYRIPDLQPLSAPCPTGSKEPAQVDAFRNEVSSISGAKILLATGDNFGPDLGARAVCNANGDLIPKERSPWPGGDNVANFFRALGFSALVPGKLDFHYGPERLLTIARYLAGKDGPGSPVQMLGANFTIETTVVNPPAETRKPEPAINYSTAIEGGTKFHLPKTLLPYIRQFDIDEGARVSTSVTSSSGVVQTQALRARDLNTPGLKNAPEARYRFAWLCPGELGPRFNLAPACRPLVVDTPRGTTLTVEMPREWPRFPSASSALQAGAPMYVCASATSSSDQFSKTNTLCSGTLRPHVPYFQDGKEQGSPLPYVLAGGNSVAIFGVVDPGLLSEVGELNYSWRNSNPAYQTKLQVSDPLEALSQVLQTCDSDPACHGARKILLAQMPVSMAQRISAQLRGRFLAVVTQADPEEATNDSSLTERRPPEQLSPLLLVPGTNYTESDQEHLRVTAQRADIAIEETERRVDNTMEVKQVALNEQPFSGSKPLWQLMVSAKLAPPPGKTPDYKAVVVDSVLRVMRDYCKADAAFLQHRDLFLPVAYAFKQPSPAQLQRLLDELLWKGDLVTCRSVSGKVLAEMKKESDQYDSEDQDRLNEHVEVRRGLDYLGMFPNSTGLVVDGNPVESGELYSIATTDYLGLGDTGYPALHDPSVPPPPQIADMRHLDEISALVCDAIAVSLPDDDRAKTTCREPADPETYFDEITMAPLSNPSGVTWLEKLAAWTDQNWNSHNILDPVKTNEAEVEAQNKRVLSLRLDRADFGFQQNLHSLSENQQQNRFGGVQAAEPTAPERYDTTLDWLLRLTSSGKDVDRFIQTDAQYETSAVRQIFSTVVNGAVMAVPVEPYGISQPKNSVGVEAGITTHLIPGSQKNVTGLKLLTSARFETELASPFLQFQAADGYLREQLPRKNALLGKVGLRYDGASSWLEAGFQSGPFTQVTSLKLGPLRCDPSFITNCISPDGGATILSLSQLAGRSFTVDSGQRNQSGFFLNARVHVPILFKRLDYVIENAGAIYINRPGDSSADTRYLEVMTHSVAIPVIGNLSIVPKVELFLFQNKVAGWHIHGYQTAITAQYRFDWHTGLRWGQAFKYPSPPHPNVQ
jgi:hypothetical protein